MCTDTTKTVFIVLTFLWIIFMLGYEYYQHKIHKMNIEILDAAIDVLKCMNEKCLKKYEKILERAIERKAPGRYTDRLRRKISMTKRLIEARHSHLQ